MKRGLVEILKDIRIQMSPDYNSVINSEPYFQLHE